MPPQPLSQVRSKAIVHVGPQAVELRPDLAPFIAQIIALWADVEASVCAIMTRLLSAEARPTTAMLSVIRSASTQFDMVEAAAIGKLVNPSLEMLLAVLSTVRRAAKIRNRIAHHVWAHCDDLPDALILIEPEAFLEIFVRLEEAEVFSLSPDDPRVQPDRSRSFVFRQKDFKEIVEELKNVWFCSYQVRHLARPRHPRRDEIFALLSKEPAIEAALRRICSNPP